MKIILSLFVLAFLPFSFHAQTYWQQSVAYTINVKLDDQNHIIRGYESFVYSNNSPQALNDLYIHIWPNAYRDGSSALAKQQYAEGKQLLQFGNDSIKGGIDSLDFKINGQPAKWEYDKQNQDIVKITLATPLASGSQLTVTTPFKVKIPSGEISRLGHVGQSYQITQWYPKPAVYDANGWNAIPYLNQGEFYSEYGTYDVSITLPKNYVVGATGDLQTPSELDFLNELAKNTAASIDKYTSKDEKLNSFPASSTEWKTIRYTQKDVHDFAWFADKRYLVLKGQVELPDTKRIVTSWAMFTPKNAALWKKSIEYINDGTFYYSKWNGEYPYNQVTAVDGTISAGGGMEYPNVTVIGNTSNAMELEIVIVHEVGHNWFYGILGSNERVHGWMDEGMNTLNELRYIYTKYPSNKYMTDLLRGQYFHMDHLSHYDMSDISFKMMAKLGDDQPIETHSADFTSANYGAVMYMKTGLVFNYLKAYLGDELFDQCMHTYFNEWKFKHPMPADMKATLERVSKKNLSWLFDDLIQTTKHIDYKLSKVKSTDSGTEVTVRNSGEVNGPIEVSGYQNGKLVHSQWVEPSDQATTVQWKSKVDEVFINGSNRIPEMNESNNYWHAKGLFGKLEPVKVDFGIGHNDPKKNNIFWTPALGGNHYDQFMLGLTLHNLSIPFNRFQYVVAPMYSFGRKGISGIADLSWNCTPANGLKLSRFGISTRSFKNNDSLRGNDGYYVSVQPYWLARIGNRKAASPTSHTVLVQSMYRLDKFGPSQRELVGGYVKYDYALKKPDYTLDFGVRHDYLANVVNGDHFSRSSVEAKYRYRYLKNKKERWLELRVFAGKYWDFNMYHSGNALNYTYALSGSSGSQDVFVEDHYFGRSESTGFYAQQRQDNMGNFHTTNNFGSNSGWLTTANFFIQSPVGPKILGFYGDLGMFQIGLTGKASSAYTAGIALRTGKIFGVYFPCVMSKDLSDSYGSQNYWSKIRFTLHLNLTNKPFSLSSIL